VDLFIDLKPERATGKILLNFLVVNKQLLHSFRINKAYIKGYYIFTLKNSLSSQHGYWHLISLYFSARLEGKSARLEGKSEVILQNKSL